MDVWFGISRADRGRGVADEGAPRVRLGRGSGHREIKHADPIAFLSAVVRPSLEPIMISSGAREALVAAAAFADGETSGATSAFFTFVGSVPLRTACGFSTEVSVSVDASGAALGVPSFSALLRHPRPASA